MPSNKEVEQSDADHINAVQQSDKNDTEAVNKDQSQPEEVGGRKGPDPTRYGDWEKNGRCIDF